MSVRYIFDLFADIRYSWVLRFLPENQCAERERGRFEFNTMFILYLCTQLGNEFLVTFYTPRNSNAGASFFPKQNKVHTGKNHDQYIHTLYSSVLLPQAVALYSVKIRGGLTI